MTTLKLSGLNIFSVIFILLTITGCKNQTILKSISLGSPGEILFITQTDRSGMNSLLAIQEYFDDEFPGLLQGEKLFSVMHIASKNFTGHLKTFRNILSVKVDSTASRPLIQYSRNRWSDYQQIVEITASSNRDVLDLISKELTDIKAFFYNGDINRFIANNRRFVNHAIGDKILKEFGVEMIVPDGYHVKKDTTGFLWLQKDNRDMSVGIMIYDMEVNDTSKLDITGLKEIKSSVNYEMVKGFRDSSYMACENLFPYQYTSLKLNGEDWTELRGLWKMEGDLMGGPYVTLFKQTENRIIVLDAFLYAPGDEHKSNKIRALDAILRSVKLNG